MGPLRESSKEQKTQLEKETARSRIPRLVLRPQQKVSPASESPFSEEESREFNPPSSSGGSRRTISSNSFCSDDTGCPSSQSVSPVKTPSDAGNSPISFCTGSDGDFSRKKFSPGTMSEGNPQLARYKKEAKASLVKPGSEADFSSSSSTGSISAPEVHMSTPGSKRSSFSRNRGPYGRNNGSLSYKTGASPPASREKDPLSTLCKNQLSPANIHQSYRASSASSSNSGSYKGSDSSPVMRQVSSALTYLLCIVMRSGRYSSCGDNHGIKPQNPEQYLTPLQQKEVTVRHLKTKLKEAESKLKERETEIEELKGQLVRMREDWIEEECNRVEAELALKEAKDEIKQLKQVIETMKNSMAEKDEKIQKYFVDINIQNKKLESLLQSMEAAQNSSVRDEQYLENTCDLEEKSFALCATMPDSFIMEDQVLEEVADSGLLLNENTANGTDLSEESLTTTSVWSDAASSSASVDKEMLGNVLYEKLTYSQGEKKSNVLMVEQAIQTDVVPYSLDMEQLIQNIFRCQDACPLSPPSSLKELSEFSHGSFSDSGIVVDLTPTDPNSAILLSPMESPCRQVEHRVKENRFMKELDFTEADDEEEAFGFVNTISQAAVKKTYWSSSLLKDVLAVAAPVVPTLMWAFSTQRGGTDPIYSIGALLRGCCLVALHSLRHAPFTIKT
ncbi:Sybu [Columba guinea]|nr:Sybu [Columba guinea]